MPASEVDAVARHDGFADALVASGLADATPEGIRLHGDHRAASYAKFRQLQSERGIKSGEARIGNGSDKTSTMVQPRLNQEASISSGDLFPDLNPESGHAKSDAKGAATSWLAWFNQHFTRRLTVTQALVKQVKALMSQGYQENPDLRGVALYLESLWAGKADMAVYLVPASILRVTKFEERLDLAKEWRPKHWGIAPVIASPRVQVPVTQGPKAEYVDKAEIASLALELAKMKGATR